MAKLGGFIRKFIGSIGNVTFKRVAGRTIASEKIEPSGNPSRTHAQMVQRVQWANIINLYRAFSGTLHPSFESKAPGVSDFNEFLSTNLGIVPVYLTKDEARQGGNVAANYQVTRGSLPSITVQAGTGDVPVTDISLGSLTLGPSTTLKEFSKAVVNNNSDFEYGDQISAFIATQSVNIETQVPYVKILSVELTLDRNDSETLLRDVVGAEGFSMVDNHLGASQPVEGAVTWVHSRKTQNGTKVSTQRFYVTNSILASYQSLQKRSAAIKSYGGSKPEAFLTPNVVESEI